MINEIKGHLFEYLVGWSLARHYRVEKDFIRGFAGNLRSRLTSYQSFLQQNDEQLYRQLPLLSHSTVQSLLSYLPSSIKNIRVIGKIAGASCDQTWHEADILLEGEGIIPISLKLCKENSFVNTKSGGVKSFLSKYFASLPDHKKWQQILTQSIEHNFLRMVHELYDAAGLEYAGKFDKQWEKYGNLPGQLPKELAFIVGRYYSRVICVVHEAFFDFQKSKPLFLKSLLPLLGMGEAEMIQVICFHKGTDRGANRYSLSRVSVNTHSSVLDGLEKMKIKPMKKGLSSFELKGDVSSLQIRLKPMNKFTVPALKVNCSLKS